MPADSELSLACNAYLDKVRTQLSPTAIEKFVNICCSLANKQTLNTTDTLTAIIEFCEVLKGRSDLLKEFNDFLPQGYAIDVRGEEIHVRISGDVVLTEEEVSSVRGTNASQTPSP